MNRNIYKTRIVLSFLLLALSHTASAQYLVIPSQDTAPEDFYASCVDLNRDNGDDHEESCKALSEQIESQSQASN